MVETYEQMIDAAAAPWLPFLEALENYGGEFADHREERAFEAQMALVERLCDRAVAKAEREWNARMDAAGL